MVFRGGPARAPVDPEGYVTQTEKLATELGLD